MRKLWSRAISLVFIVICLFSGCKSEEPINVDTPDTPDQISSIVSIVSIEEKPTSSLIEEESEIEFISSNNISSDFIDSNIDEISTIEEIVYYETIEVDTDNIKDVNSKTEFTNSDNTSSILEDTDMNTEEDTDIDSSTTSSETEEVNSTSPMLYTPSDFQFSGVIYWGGWRWTWYSQRVLPGGGLVIPGRHVDANGYVCDENDYICLAATSLSKGTIVDTPFGKQGKVYDSGCAYGTLDVYVNW